MKPNVLRASYLIAIACIGGCARPHPASSPISAPKDSRPAVISVRPNAHAIAYDIMEISTLGGPNSEAHDINDHGDVTGQADRAQGKPHGFLFRGGKLVDLGAFRDEQGTCGLKINNRGQIAGTTSYDGAFFWEKGRLQPIRAVRQPDNYMAYWIVGINDSGTVIGTADFSTFWIGYLWRHGKGMSMQRSPRIETLGLAINNHGEYLWRDLGRPEQKQVLLHQAGRDRLACLTSDENPEGDAGLTDNGDFFLSQSNAHSTLYIRHGASISLPMAASDINVQRTIVGQKFLDPSDYRNGRACRWQNGRVQDLNDLIDPASGWVLETAEGINKTGQIVGTGRHLGHRRGFILTPRSNAPARASQ